MEIESLKKVLERVEDPGRTVGGYILHKLEDIIIIGLCTLLCNGEDFTDMEAFGELREERQRKSLDPWSCRMGYQTATHSGEYFNESTRKLWRNACMTGWDAIGKRERSSR
ncbi:MAG: transposase family protein [Oscillospiraceae bacterium]|nr:transposase family protein [Oscillospiraceae bacterium]